MWLAVLAVVTTVPSIVGFGLGNGIDVEVASAKSDDKSSAHITAKRDKKIAAQVPAAIRKKGTLIIASDATYPPNEFIRNGKVVGMDADLAVALAQVMGLKVKVRNVVFDAIIPGLASKKYDVGLSSFTDTKEREKVVNFVTYFKAGTSFYVRSGSGVKVTSLNNLCGRTVAVQKGTIQADDATAQSKKCEDADRRAVKVLTFPTQTAANLAITSRRAGVGMADSPVAAFIVKQSNDRLKLSGKPYGTAPYGIALQKRSGMPKPMRNAVRKLISTGEYRKILKKWGVLQGALTSKQIKINGATS